VVLTTGDCSLFHQKNFGGFFGRFRSLLRRAPRRQWSLWLNSQVFAASLLGSSTFSIFSGVLLWTRPRPALTGRYTGHASRAVPFPRPSSPQKPRGSIRDGVNALPILVKIGPPENRNFGAFLPSISTAGLLSYRAWPFRSQYNLVEADVTSSGS